MAVEGIVNLTGRRLSVLSEVFNGVLEVENLIFQEKKIPNFHSSQDGPVMMFFQDLLQI